MELEDIEVSYDFPMNEIKRRFLSALLEKYQWMMLFLPFLECQIEEKREAKTIERPFQWTDIVDGAFSVVEFRITRSLCAIYPCRFV
jgi:hypothetical protein